jgi:hypothetical protein
MGSQEFGRPPGVAGLVSADQNFIVVDGFVKFRIRQVKKFWKCVRN